MMWNRRGISVLLFIAVCGIGVASPVTSGVPSGARPLARLPGADKNFRSLYSFKDVPDGANPEGDLLPLNGALYGTTWTNGKNKHGTIFKVSLSGAEDVLYSFNDLPDSGYPAAGLLAMNGALYGTTQYGGHDCYGRFFGCGSVFALDSSGKERVLHRFRGSPDGEAPLGDLLARNGSLYGTTSRGGAHRFGTVFEATSSGTTRLVYEFKGAPDGAAPYAGLLPFEGKLYGTTRGGGAANNGTVFELSPSGAERIVYSFRAGSDGVFPVGTLVALDGALYGTTEFGGTSQFGTIFEVRPSGAERVIHSFQQSDGSYPLAGLVAVRGLLYGTTSEGGNTPNGGDGTVFEITTSGVERVLHNFQGPDGISPQGELREVNGTFYGTTTFGGSKGAGTVFAIAP